MTKNFTPLMPPTVITHFPAPLLRPDLQVAIDAMNATPGRFAYAVCRNWNDTLWEVNVREDDTSFALKPAHAAIESAEAAGAAWLADKQSSSAA